MSNFATRTYVDGTAARKIERPARKISMTDGYAEEKESETAAETDQAAASEQLTDDPSLSAETAAAEPETDDKETEPQDPSAE